MRGFLRVPTYPGCARFKFGRSRLGGVRSAADIPASIGRCRPNFAAFALEADVPALLRQGALEALGGQLDVSCNMLTLRKERADIFRR